MKRAMLLAVLVAATASRHATADEMTHANEGWPRELKQGATVYTVYQPQLLSWNGFKLESQAVVSVSTDGGKSTFGVIWLSARTTVNKVTRLVALEDLAITRASFPSAPGMADGYADALRAQLSRAPKVIALDRLEADLAIQSEKKSESLAVRNDPPEILFSPIPALLVNVDGSPAYRLVAGTSFLRVVNTRPLLLKDPAGTHFLHYLDGWLQAPTIHGPWSPTRNGSAELELARKQAVATGTVDLLQAPKRSLATGPVPSILVVTRPTELIVTDGEPSWAPIGGATRLFYVQNTSGHLFEEMDDHSIYLLVSGRWFRAMGLNGPWSFVPPARLPADFARIPDDSPKENVKASVPGTPQAEEALIANSVPETAKVDRKRAQLTPPKYDGDPQLRAIQGTELQYVANSTTPIIVVGPNAYYAVENGIWFTATALTGRWYVAASVPAVIYTIPPSSPVHYVTYVRVYEATPDFVYVGYTPGYFGTCVSGGVVVYGTGYAYAGWVGAVWVGPPVTYGFGVNVAYTPWTGWSFAVGFGWSAHAAVGPYGAAAWGPGGWAATTGTVYSHWGSTGAVTRSSAGYNAWTGNAWAGQSGASYNSRTGVASAGQRGAVQNAYTGNYAAGGRGVVQGPGGVTAAGARATVGNAATGQSVTAGRGVVYNPTTGTATTPAGIRGSNGGGVGRVGGDVYAGKDGDVYRHGSDGWQHYQNGNWQSVGDSDRARSLDQQRSARTNGESRVQSFQHSDWGSRAGRSFGRRR